MILYLSALRILVNQFGNFANPFITIELGLHENVLKLFLISKYILILTFGNYTDICMSSQAHTHVGRVSTAWCSVVAYEL